VTRTIIVPAQTLQSQVERASSVVPSAGFQQVLKNLLVQARPGRLRISGTDLDLTVVVTSPLVAGEAEDWDPVEFIIPAQRLREILKEVPEGNVRLTVHEPAEGIIVVVVEAGGSSWSLQVPEGNFAALPDVDAVAWQDFPREPFISAVRAVRFAASKDGANLGLACVNIVAQGGGGAKVTASDAGRVQQALLASFPLAVQIPAIGSPAAVDEVVKLLARNDDLEIAQVAVTEGVLLFKAGSGVFACRRLTVPGADVEHQILTPAAQNKNVLTVQRDDLLDGIRRVAVTADATTSAICLDLAPGKLTLLSRDKLRNAAEAVLGCSWDGPERRVVVNHRHLSAAVTAHSGPACEFRLGVPSAKRAAVLIIDEKAGITGVIPSLTGKFLGYE
jgi:DNA polymerase-3 subunit beta